MSTALSASQFAEAVLSATKVGDRQIRTNIGGIAPSLVMVTFINLPKGIGAAGGGAEAINNRMVFSVSGFDAKDVNAPARGNVKVEQSTSALPRSHRLRAKTGNPADVAAYLGAFLSKVAKEVPPNYTHTKV